MPNQVIDPDAQYSPTWRCAPTSRRLRKREIHCVAKSDSAALWGRAEWSLEADERERRVEDGPGVVPRGVRSRLNLFASRGGPSNGLLIKGLLPDLPSLGPTPRDVTSTGWGASARLAAAVLLDVMSVLGEPVPGRSSTCPAAGLVEADWPRVSDWYVEDTFDAYRSHYVGLLCLRGDPVAELAFSTVRGVDLAPIAQLVLREKRFTSAAAPSSTAAGVAKRETVEVLSGPRDDMRVRFDASGMIEAGRDRQARASLWHLRAQLDTSAVGVVLEPGDLLVLDNRRAVRAHSPVPLRSDGTDQWLLRAMVRRRPSVSRT